VVTREQLIEDVWDAHRWGSTKTLDVHVNSIRRKLGEPAGSASRITTIRGVGYRFEVAEETDGTDDR
jgi:DNA-binding response OmpR family regulator